MKTECRVRRLGAGIAMILVALAAGAVRGDFVVVDNFEGLDLGSIHEQNGWYAPSQGDVVTLSGEGDNQSLRVLADPAILHKDATIVNGDTRMLFLRFRFEGQHAYSFGMSHLTSPTEISDFGPELRRVSALDRLEIHNGETYDTLATLEPSVWYNLWALVDNDAGDTQVWLHSRPGEGAIAADQLDADGQIEFDFRTDANHDLVKFYIKAASGGNGQDPLWIDDIYLENGGTLNLTNPVPEPGCLILLVSAAAVLACWRRRA